MRSAADDVWMTYVPADDVWMTYMPADDVWMTYMPADDVQMMYPPADDILDDICHLPAKSPTKSHSHVICTSSAHRPHIVHTSSAHRLHETSVPRQFPVKEQRQLC